MNESRCLAAEPSKAMHEINCSTKCYVCKMNILNREIKAILSNIHKISGARPPCPNAKIVRREFPCAGLSLLFGRMTYVIRTYFCILT